MKKKELMAARVVRASPFPMTAHYLQVSVPLSRTVLMEHALGVGAIFRVVAWVSLRRSGILQMLWRQRF